jgi:hypothetical protein
MDPEAHLDSARWRLGDRILQTVDIVCGLGLASFGGLVGYRALRES